VANAHAGRGLVWNPAPFLPVEGYTSFLWVILLRFVWWSTGTPPPDAANWISLAFGAGSLWLGARFLMRMRLPARLERDRLALVAVMLAGVLSNRTFLAWLSSGLETALFNFLLIWFVYEALAHEQTRASAGWVFRLSAAAGLAALARPDGMLAAAAAIAMLLGEIPTRGPSRQWLFASPLLMVPAHFAWRRITYGEWLPNTYYAKYLGLWPESGIRYFASFALEYGLWVWLLVLAAWLTVELRALRRPLLAGLWPSRNAVLAVGTLIAHWLYYTFVIGGDHFEYRVYSHAVVLLWVAAIFMLVRIRPDRRLVYGALAAFLLASLPIPWAHWEATRHLRTRDETFRLVQPIAARFPSPVRPVVAAWDGWQAWLIDHSVCMRHQEHKIFWLASFERLPAREAGAKISWQQRVVFAYPSVGILGWVFPNVAIIDVLGLNDRVTARLPPPERAAIRQMAHARLATAAYVDCFRPNLFLGERERTMSVIPRTLTDEQIRACEARDWSDASAVRWRDPGPR
jgi:arabinofuranosyltransferase